MAIVTLAYPAARFRGRWRAAAIWCLAVDGRPVKAVTFSSVKWPHLRSAAAAPVVVRCSLGRVGEERLLQRDDADLAAPGRRRPGRGDRRAAASPPTSG